MYIVREHYRETIGSSDGESKRRGVSSTPSKLNRPFKSPVVKNWVASTESSSPSTPSQWKYKRPRSAPLPQSPLGLVNSGQVAKRKRLSVGAVSKPNMEELLRKEAELDEEIAQLHSEGLLAIELDHQIDLLHRYNDIKDAAQSVMGRLAELDGVTVKHLHDKYGAPISHD